MALRTFATREQALAWQDAGGFQGWPTTYSGTGWIVIDPTDDQRVWAYMECKEGEEQRLQHLPEW